MPPKKKGKKSITISPKLPVSPKAVDIGTLSIGDCLLYAGKLCILVEDDPKALSLLSYNEFDLDCTDKVIPINIEIKWSYKK